MYTISLMIMQGYRTMDMRCEYSRERAYWAIESASLQRNPSNNNNVRCKCDLSDPNVDGNGEVSVPFTINCILTVLRCPISQRIFT